MVDLDGDFNRLNVKKMKKDTFFLKDRVNKELVDNVNDSFSESDKRIKEKMFTPLTHKEKVRLYDEGKKTYITSESSVLKILLY